MQSCMSYMFVFIVKLAEKMETREQVVQKREVTLGMEFLRTIFSFISNFIESELERWKNGTLLNIY